MRETIRSLRIYFMLAGLQLKFGDIYKESEGSADPSAALESFLEELPVAKKTH